MREHDKKGIPAPFQEYLTYLIVNRNEFVNLSNQLFHHRLDSIYLHLHSHEGNFYIYRILDFLYKQAFDEFRFKAKQKLLGLKKTTFTAFT